MTVKIATWNVNSIRARLGRVLGWLQAQQPDIVCLQETKVVDDGFPREELHAAGYHAATFGQRTYNGVAILARTPPVDLECGFDDGVDDAQSRYIVATVATGVGAIRLASAYVPNGSAVGTDKFIYKLDWLARWRRCLDARAPAMRPQIVCGDFNVAPEDRDVFDPARTAGQVLCHPDERAALARIRDAGFVDLFRRIHPDTTAFSWWDYRQLAFPRNQGFRIDHIYATESLVDRCRGVEIDRDARKGKDPSDHAPVVATLDL